jgi:hypothetical protein
VWRPNSDPTTIENTGGRVGAAVAVIDYIALTVLYSILLCTPSTILLKITLLFAGGRAVWLC